MTTENTLEFDILIIGAGPAGLSAAIRLAQLNQEHHRHLSIAVLEKGASVGAHILSGAVLEPRALNELFPDWSQRQAPVTVNVTKDKFYFLTRGSAWRMPTPPSFSNQGNFIISLDQFCIWLAEQAEALGVQIFPGFAAGKVLFENDKVIGVETVPQGLDAQGKPKERYEPGIQLISKQTLFAEGCRGSLSEQVIKRFHLRQHSGPQSYGIGIKELWQIDPEQHRLGEVMHTVGWPLDSQTYGGSFVYHFDDNRLALGLVIGLDYQNPYLDPFQELQRFKTHPLIRSLLKNGKCIGYGARAINEGGFQAIPELSFPGGMLIGCAAGFVNVAKIKGTHTAMKSGMLAAEALFNQEIDQGLNVQSYNAAVYTSWIGSELYRVRNIRPAFHRGLWTGLAYSALDQYLFFGKAPWTFHFQPDYDQLKPAKNFQPIQYPKADGTLTFDKLTQVYLTNTSHREDQPCHLQLKDSDIPIDINLAVYDSPESRYCPAAVYEIVDRDNNPRLQINFTNCIHCKTCDIKDPTQNIVWQTPEGGDGPKYINM